jgi:hypothetical protein
MGYRGKVVEWIKERLNWTVEIVKQPRRWFRVPEGEEVPFVPAFVVLPRRSRSRADLRMGGALPEDEQRLRVLDRVERGNDLRGDAPVDAQAAC